MENNGSVIVSHETQMIANVLKIVIGLIFVGPLIHYSFYNKVHTNEINNNLTNVENNDTINFTDIINDENGGRVVLKIVKKEIIKQPSCPLSYMQVIFSEICNDLYVKKELCTPNDFHNLEKHKVPKVLAKNKSNHHEPRGTIVGYLAGGLLLTSLGAALIELYKAKNQTPAKPPLNRKCSLADLTVLKHNRKELVRTDSIMEVPEENGGSRQIGFRPKPLNRRCSFPVGPSEFSYGFNNGINPVDSRRTSMDSKRLSIIGDSSRRPSVEFRSSLTYISGDSRRVSVDNDSPERRHHSRLFHRH